MSKFVIVIFIISILCILFFYINDNKPIHKNLSQDNQSNNITVKQNSLSENQITVDLDENITTNKNINDIFHSEENIFSENTNQLISNSFNELLTNVYKNIIMKIGFNHMGTNNIIDFNIQLFKDTDLSNNFIQNIRNYYNSAVFNFDEKYGTLFLGDYFNNNGTANYTVDHSLLEVNYPITNFIPSNSICMIGVKQNDKMYVGCQFIVNCYDITDKNFINKYNLIPFGKFNIDDEHKTMNFIKNYFNKNKNTKPKIVFINDNDTVQKNSIQDNYI